MLAGREKHLRGERPMCPLAQAQPGVPPPSYNASCPIISRPFLGRVEKKLRREGLEPPTTAVPGGRQSLYPLTNAVPTVQRDRPTCLCDANVYIHQLLRQERPCVQKKKILLFHDVIITMAKSLRSHSKLAARNAKRYTEGTDYAVTAAARLQQVSDRLKQRLQAPKLSETNKDEEEKMDDAHDNDKEADMQVEAPAKISTSHPHDSSKDRWRRKMRKKGARHGTGKKRRQAAW